MAGVQRQGDNHVILVLQRWLQGYKDRVTVK